MGIMTNTHCLSIHIHIYVECILVILCMSPPHSRPILSSSPPSLSPQKADLYRLYHPTSHPMGFNWTWPIVSTRRMVRGLEEREREGYLSFSLLLSAVVLPGAKLLQDQSSSSTSPPPWCQRSLDIPWLPVSWCLTMLIGFLNLAYVCVNSSFIKRISFALSEWNSVFC